MQEYVELHRSAVVQTSTNGILYIFSVSVIFILLLSREVLPQCSGLESTNL